jgi:hypothetical protein
MSMEAELFLNAALDEDADLLDALDEGELEENLLYNDDELDEDEDLEADHEA